jgi:hypothetical protein
MSVCGECQVTVDTPAIMWLPDLAALILAAAANSPKPIGSHLAQ